MDSSSSGELDSSSLSESGDDGDGGNVSDLGSSFSGGSGGSSSGPSSSKSSVSLGSWVVSGLSVCSFEASFGMYSPSLLLVPDTICLNSVRRDSMSSED